MTTDYRALMPTRDSLDLVLRRRIVAHMQRLVDERFGGSARQLALRIGVHPTTVTRYLSGERTPGLDLLYKLHRGIGVSADVFLDDDPRHSRRPAAVERAENAEIERARDNVAAAAIPKKTGA